MTPFVLKSYVDEQDAYNATKAYIDNKDAERLRLNRINVNNGVPGLDAKGKVDIARVNVPSTQRYPMGIWSPAAYNAGVVTATNSETTVYTCSVADPGFAYRLLVTGQVDVTTSLDGEYPIIRVREDSTIGTLVAMGRGNPQSYNHSTATVVPYFSGVTPIPPTFDAIGDGFTGYGVNPTPTKYYGNVGGVNTFTYNHTVAANSYLIVDGTALGGHVMTGCTYRGVPMNLLASVALNNNPASGAMYRFGLAVPTAGTGAVSGGLTANAWLSVESVSYSGVQGIGPSTTMYSFGTNSHISQSVTCFPGQLILQAFGADGSTPKWTATGGIERYSMGHPSGSDCIDLLSVSDTTVSTTFRMDATNIANSAGISTPIIGDAGFPPSRTGPTTLHLTISRSGTNSTVSATAIEPSLCVMAIPA